MRLMTLLMAFNILLSGCSTIKKPNTDLCIVNAPAKHRKCYNLKTDYDDNGKLKPGAAPVYRSNVTVDDLNKATLIDSPTGFEDGLADLKSYIKKLREAYEEQCRSK